MVEVSSLMSRVASQNNNDGEIDLETFETLIVNYLRSQRNTIDTNSPQKLENLAIYVTDKDGLLVLDSRGLTLGTDMRDANEVESALSGMIRFNKCSNRKSSWNSKSQRRGHRILSEIKIFKCLKSYLWK